MLRRSRTSNIGSENGRLAVIGDGLRDSSKERTGKRRFRDSLKPTVRKTGLYAGVLAVPVGTAGPLIAVASDRTFNFFTQNISSVMNRSDPTLLGINDGTLLSSFMVTAGVLGVGYAVGLRESLPPKSWHYDLGAGLFILGSVALSASGIIHPSPVINPHFGAHDALAATAAIAGGIGEGLIGIDLIKKGARTAGKASLATAGVSLAALVTGFLQNHHVPAAWEFTSIFSTGAWISLMSAMALAKGKLTGDKTT